MSFFKHSVPKEFLTGILTALLAALLVCPALAATSSASSYHVLFLSSYAYSWDSVPLQLDGIGEVVRGDVDLDVFFMNSKYESAEAVDRITHRKVRAALNDGAAFDAVLLGDDAALSFALRHREELFDGIPLVFEGINSVSLAEESAKDPLITGVTETFPIKETIEMARLLYPKATRLVAISDSTPSGIGSTKQLFACQGDFPDLSFEVLDCASLTQAELIETVSKLDEDAILLFLLMTHDADGNYYSNRDAARFFHDNAGVPVFKADELGIGFGMLGGCVISYREMGHLAGDMLMEILGGTPVSEVPSVSISSRKLIDYAVAKEAGVRLSALPDDVIYINHDLSFFEEHKYVLIPASIISVLLLSFSIYARRRYTAIQKLMDETREKTLMLDNLINNLPGGVGIYRVGEKEKVYFFSDGLAALVGRTREEYKAMLRSDILGATVYEEDLPEIRMISQRAAEFGAPMVATFRMKHASGKLVWVQLSSIKIREEKEGNVYYAVFTQLPNESVLYKQIADCAHNGVYVCDAETLDLIYVNDVLQNILGRNDYEGKKCYEYLSQSDSPCALCHRSAMTEERSATRESYLEQQDMYLALEGHLSRVDDRLLIIDYTTDITEIRKQLQSKELQLARATEQANAANKAKSTFLSQMSHDMRTPMNSILGLTALAKNEFDNPELLRDYLGKIGDSANFLLALINDCLDMEKIAQGKMTLHPAPYSYRDFNQSIQTMIGPLCEQKHITFTIQPRSEANTIVTDRVRFEQIFFNLLSNSVKFTPEGGHIELLYRNDVYDGDMLTLDYIVRDSGCGMSEEFQKRMFQPFEQEHDGTTSRQQGTGLGLAIVKSIVDMMGGTLTVCSRQGIGTDMIVRLTTPTLPPEVETQEYVEPQEHVEALAGRNILLVEDNPVNVLIAMKLLENRGSIVTVAENGKDAVNAFAASPENHFDAILMDIQMPLMNGIEATISIRDLPRVDAKNVPIIAMTANAFAEDFERSLQSGMNAHLSKPIIPELMYNTIAEQISKRKADLD